MDYEESEMKRKIAVFEGEGRIGEIIKEFATIRLTPEDFSSPIALQMALSRIYGALLKSMEKGPKKHYVAEIRFRDSLENTIVFAIDLGEEPPPFTRKNIKARIIVELFEE